MPEKAPFKTLKQSESSMLSILDVILYKYSAFLQLSLSTTGYERTRPEDFWTGKN
jgi:hypothetical protein